MTSLVWVLEARGHWQTSQLQKYLLLRYNNIVSSGAWYQDQNLIWSLKRISKHPEAVRVTTNGRARTITRTM